MTSLLATRRRADDFARLVDGTRTTHDPTLVPLLDLVARLRRPASIEPTPEFSSALRDQLLAEAAALPADGGAGPVRLSHVRTMESPPRAKLFAFATALSLIAGVIGIAMFARQALPGEALYSVKRGLEQTQASIATNPESRGRQVLASSQTRLDEATALVAVPKRNDDSDSHRYALVKSTLSDFTAQTKQGGDLMIKAYENGRQRAPLVKLREFTTNSTQQLAALGPNLPTDLLPTLEGAKGVVSGLEERVIGICRECVPDSPKPITDPTSSSITPSESPTMPPTTPPTTPGLSVPPDPTQPRPTEPSPTGPTGPEPTTGPLLPLPTELPLPRLPLIGDAG